MAMMNKQSTASQQQKSEQCHDINGNSDSFLPNFLFFLHFLFS